MALTIDDIRAMSKSVLLPSEAAQVLGCDPQCTSDHRVKIPREPFIRFIAGQKTEPPNPKVKDVLALCKRLGILREEIIAAWIIKEQSNVCAEFNH